MSDMTPVEVHHAWMLDRLRAPGIADLLGRPLGDGVAVDILWALALEIDEWRATVTGERVCRVCSGVGETLAFISTTVERHGRVKRHIFDDFPCSCEAGVESPSTGRSLSPEDWISRVVQAQSKSRPPTRPHTVSLHRLVATLASWRSPVVTDWPEQWLADRDEMEAHGWDDVTLTGRSEVTPAWVCQWWRAFGEWTATGRVDDVDALADALTQASAHRDSRRLYRLSVRQETLSFNALYSSDRPDALTMPLRGRPGFSELHMTPPELERWASEVSIGYRTAIDASHGTIVGLRHALLSLPGVRGVLIREHDPATIEVFVSGGDDQAIAETIYTQTTAGVSTVGNVTVDRLDPFGGPVSFSRHPALDP